MEDLFKIYRFNEADAAMVAGSPNEPHQHDYEELIIGMEGSLEHFIDFKITHIDAPFASFITKGKTHRIRAAPKSDQCDFWVIRFRSEFIPETTFQLYNYYHDSANVPFTEGICFERLVRLCGMIHGEYIQQEPELSIIRNLLSALFTMIEAERKKKTPEAVFQKTQSITFRNFLSILEENYKRAVGVEYYAEKLFMSVRNLNLICHNILQKSVSEIIETRKLIEAKNLLMHTDMPVSEIGYELGYNEKAYFTSIFKKKSGQTPTEFREEMRLLIS